METAVLKIETLIFRV